MILYDEIEYVEVDGSLNSYTVNELYSVLARLIESGHGNCEVVKEFYQGPYSFQNIYVSEKLNRVSI